MMLLIRQGFSLIGLIAFLFYVGVQIEPITIGIIIIAMFALSHFAPNSHKNGGKLSAVIQAVVATLIAACLVVGENVIHNGNTKSSIADAYIKPMGYTEICLVILLSIFVYSSISLLHAYVNMIIDRISQSKSPFISSLRKPITHNHFAVICFGCLIACWGVCFLTYYPGTAVHDTKAIMANPVGSSTQHTILYNMLLYGLVSINTNLFGDASWGAACYSLVQMLYCAFAATYFINWMVKERLPAFVVVGTLLFFMLSRIIALITIVTLKDVIFSFSMLIVIPILCDAVKTKGEMLNKKTKLIMLSCASAIIVLIRNNGLYVMIPTLFALLLIYRKYYKKILVVCLLGILLPCSIDAILMRTVVKNEKMPGESLAVPLQQIAATVTYDGNITDEELEVINEIMPVEDMKQYYTPLTVDGLKWNANGTLNRTWIGNNMGQFLKLWVGLLPDNLNTYIEAYLLETLSYWKIGEPSKDQSVYYEYTQLPENTFEIENKRLLPESIQTSLESYYKLSNAEIPSAATLFWLIIIVALLRVKRSSYYSLFPYLPTILVWGTLMLSCPHAFVFRYVYCFYLVLPLYIAMLFTPVSCQVRKTQNRS